MTGTDRYVWREVSLPTTIGEQVVELDIEHVENLITLETPETVWLYLTARGRDAEAYKQDPEFYKLIRTLESYKKFLDENTTVILSSDSELLELLSREDLRRPKK